MDKMTAAHKRLAFDTWLQVRNLSNGRKTRVRITDRGPFVGNRIIDLSRAAAGEIGMIRTGTARVRIKKIRPPRSRSRVARSASSKPARNSKRYDIQLGAFRSRPNAAALLERIRASGHRASVARTRSGGRVVYRVLTAGGNERQAAEKIKELKGLGFDAVLRPRRG